MKFKALMIILMIVFPLSFSFAEEEGVIRTTIKNQKFIPDVLHVKSESPFILQVTNQDSIPVEIESSDLNKERLVHPGKTINIKMQKLQRGVYEFFSDFGPKELRGKIIVE